MLNYRRGFAAVLDRVNQQLQDWRVCRSQRLSERELWIRGIRDRRMVPSHFFDADFLVDNPAHRIARSVRHD